jgi:hypothetical protein
MERAHERTSVVDGVIIVVPMILSYKPIMDITSAGAALCYAAAQGDVTTVEQLLLAGAAVHAANQQGLTAVHAAALKGHAELVELLLGQWTKGTF